jgi:predicted nucleotidyltransferase
MIKFNKSFAKFFIGKSKDDIRIFNNESHIDPIILSEHMETFRKMMRDYIWEIEKIYGKKSIKNNSPARGSSTRFPFDYISTTEEFDIVKAMQRENI